MAYCKNCGSLNNDGVYNCAVCGAPMEVAQPQQPVYQANPYQQPVYQAAPVVPGKGLGIASMILGIASLVLFCFWYLALPCAIAGIIMGCIANSKAKAAGMKNGMAVAGIVCSAIAIGLTVIILVLGLIGLGTLAEYGYYY